jgi:hypothetical protein
MNNMVKVISFFTVSGFMFFVAEKQGVFDKSKKIDSVRIPASSCNDLDSKLQNQWNLYDQAREEIVDRVTKDRGYLTPRELNKIITPTSNCKFSRNDINELKDKHQQIIDQSKSDAVKDSVIKISEVKNNGRIKQFCEELPKGGVLHLHPSGVLDDETIRELGDRRTGKYFLSDSQHSFESFDSIFGHLRSLLGMGLSNNLKYGIEKYLSRASKEGVIYVEFGKLFSASNATERQLADWADEFYNKYGVVVRWKAGFVRVHGYGGIKSQISSLLENEYRHRKISGDDGFTHIVGVDLYGNERHADALGKGQYIYAPLYAMANNKHHKGWKTKLKTTIHAGEIGNERNPRDAMIMGVDRIGHGVSMINHPLDLEYARIYKNGQGLPVEINIVSNHRLSAVDSYKKHPFLTFLRLGMPVSLSTDDEGIFQTTISTECEVAVKNSDIEYSELKQMSYNSIEHAFVDDDTKDGLKLKLDGMFSSFESKWKKKYGK